MIKRTFDIFFSLCGLIILAPLLLLIAILIKIDSKGPIFFLQNRVGLNEKEFLIYKFRTMREGAEKGGLLTIGDKDNRITRIGYYLRKYKLDEIPQLMNVLIGEMSIVGPRPEVKKYVGMYTLLQKNVFKIKPGITDYASIEYAEENNLLAAQADPEEIYIKSIMPAKLALNLKYIQERNLLVDFKIIIKTLFKIISVNNL